MPTTYSGAVSTDTSQAPALPPALAQWLIPQSAQAPPTNSLAGVQEDAGVIAALAAFFHLKDNGRQTMQDQVISALARHYNVQMETPGTIGTQRVQEAVGGTPGRAGGREGEVTEQQPTSTSPEPIDVGKVVEEIALKAGSNGSSLTDIAQSLGVHDTWTQALSLGKNETAASAYANFVKQLSSTAQQQWTPNGPKQTFKQAMAQYLEAGNFLDANTNGGTPDNANIAAAYQKLLASAQKSNTDLNAAYAQNQQASDVPATGAQPVTTSSETYAFVEGMGEKLGIYLSPQDINKIANQYVGDVTNAGGPSTIQDEIKNTVVQYFNPDDPRNPPGAANDMYEKVLAAATQYGIPIASADIKQWVVNGITNSAGDSYSIAQAATDTAAAAAEHYQQLAAGLYPTLSKQIMAGQDVQTLIAPYNNITAQYLGVDPASLNNPGSADGGPTGKYFKFLQGATDPTTGTPTMQTMDQWKKTLMQDPSYGFQNTQGAKNMASQFSSALLNEFGLVNTDGGSNQPFNSYSNTPGSANT